MTHRQNCFFISEVSSNHARDMNRCVQFIEKSAEIGCDAVKFQLFKIDQLFAPEILARSKNHSDRGQWELPLDFLPDLSAACQQNEIQFSCTPFYLKAVEELFPFVDFYKIASYEMIWDDLIVECAKTGKPLYMSTGMATLDEVCHATDVFHNAGGKDLTLFHCVSGYPVAAEHCNLAAIETIRMATDQKVGWSDHSRNPDVVATAINKWSAKAIEFHLDLDEEGAEYKTGHCWLPEETAPVIAGLKGTIVDGADGNGHKNPTPAEIDDRDWRADPSDGLRPLKHVRNHWVEHNIQE